MDVFGLTRSSIARNHALIAPESFVRSTLPGWERSEVVVLISPRMGAQFMQYLASMEQGGVSGPAPPGFERVVYVLEGDITLTIAPHREQTLRASGYAFLPADVDYPLRTNKASKLNVFEKRYVL